MTQKKRKYTKRNPGKMAKEKGRRFEQDVADLFTKWSELKWRRVPQSGGWNKRVVSGDVFCEAEYIGGPRQKEVIFVPFSCECKKQEGWDFSQLFLGSDKCPIRRWWTQTTEDAKEIKKLPALIFTRNYLPIFIMVSTYNANRITRLTGQSWKKFTHFVCFASKKEQVVILLFEDFLSWVPFRTLLKLTV